MQRTTYKQRREGKAGIGAHTTRMMATAHRASIDPHGTQKALGLADADRRMKAHKLKQATNRARAMRDKRNR